MILGNVTDLGSNRTKKKIKLWTAHGLSKIFKPRTGPAPRNTLKLELDQIQQILKTHGPIRTGQGN